MFDEPTLLRDLRAQGIVLTHLRRLAPEDGATIVFTTHDPNQALRVGGRTPLMFGGRDYACGSPEDVLTDENVGRLHGVMMVRLHAPISESRPNGITAMLPNYSDRTV